MDFLLIKQVNRLKDEMATIEQYEKQYKPQQNKGLKWKWK